MNTEGMRTLLNTLWSKAYLTPDYDKAQWVELERMMIQAGHEHFDLMNQLHELEAQRDQLHITTPTAESLAKRITRLEETVEGMLPQVVQSMLHTMPIGSLSVHPVTQRMAQNDPAEAKPLPPLPELSGKSLAAWNKIAKFASLWTMVETNNYDQRTVKQMAEVEREIKEELGRLYGVK